MIAESFIIAFGSVGVDRLKAQIKALDKNLEAFAKKAANELIQSETNVDKLRRRKFSNYLKFQNTEYSKQAKARSKRVKQEIQELNTLDKAKKKVDKGSSSSGSSSSSNGSRRGGGGGSSGSKTLGTVMKISVAVFAMAETLKAFYGYTKDINRRNIIYDSIRRQTGLDARTSEGFDVEVMKHGGSRMEGTKTLSNFNAAIGAMKYGDTGLINILGKYGIGGIHAGSSSEDVLRAVDQRSKGMDEKESQALFNELGLSDAIQRLIREGRINDAFTGKDPVEISKESEEAFRSQTEADYSIEKFEEKLSTELSGIQKILADILAEFPYIKTTWDGIRKILEIAFPAAAASLAYKALFGAGGAAAGAGATGGTGAAVATSGTVAAAPETAIGAAGVLAGGIAATTVGAIAIDRQMGMYKSITDGTTTGFINPIMQGNWDPSGHRRSYQIGPAEEYEIGEEVNGFIYKGRDRWEPAPHTSEGFKIPPASPAPQSTEPNITAPQASTRTGGGNAYAAFSSPSPRHFMPSPTSPTMIRMITVV